jgi:hypothetical protein
MHLAGLFPLQSVCQCRRIDSAVCSRLAVGVGWLAKLASLFDL